MSKIKLLFVCLGNICRSPAAEGVMKHLIAKKGLDNVFEVDSAGIGAWHVGELPDERMRKAGAERGYNFNSHARQFQDEDFLAFNHILIMDNENKKALYAKTDDEEKRKKVHMLAHFCKSFPHSTFIPDPYYGNMKDFNHALDLIEDACGELLVELINNKDNDF